MSLTTDGQTSETLDAADSAGQGQTAQREAGAIFSRFSDDIRNGAMLFRAKGETAYAEMLEHAAKVYKHGSGIADDILDAASEAITMTLDVAGPTLKRHLLDGGCPAHLVAVVMEAAHRMIQNGVVIGAALRDQEISDELEQYDAESW